MYNASTSSLALALIIMIAVQIKILYAGWWRDDTWPKGAAPPENDPFFDSPLLVSLSDVPAPTMFPGVSETTSGAPSDTTSWLLDID